MFATDWNSIETLLLRTRGLDVPEKLFAILESGIFSDILVWSLDGLSFEVKGTLEFSDRVLQHFFGQTQFTSFCRLLNSFEFRRQRRKVKERNPSDVDIVLFCHDQFQRNRPDLVSTIRRRCSSANTCRFNIPLPNRKSSPTPGGVEDRTTCTTSFQRGKSSSVPEYLSFKPWPTLCGNPHLQSSSNWHVMENHVPPPGLFQSVPLTAQQNALQQLAHSHFEQPAYCQQSPILYTTTTNYHTRPYTKLTFPDHALPPFPYEDLYACMSMEYETYFVVHDAMLQQQATQGHATASQDPQRKAIPLQLSDRQDAGPSHLRLTHSSGYPINTEI